MASESMFESFPSYPQCFMRGEYTPVFLLGSACRELSRAQPRRGAVGLEGGIQTQACGYKAIGLRAPGRQLCRDV